MATPLPFDPSQLPAHVGIIMDGNGRWARQRNQARTQGHLEGLKAAKRVVKAASDAGLRFVTLYVFPRKLEANRRRGEFFDGFD